MDKDFKNFLLNNAFGGGISFLKGYVNNKFLPVMSYHIHFLFAYDKNNDITYVVCLDKFTIQTIKNYSKLNIASQYTAFYDAMFQIASVFVEQIAQNLEADVLDEKYIFNRVPQDLWDIFNSIKTKSFIASLKTITNIDYSEVPDLKPREIHKSSLNFSISIEDLSLNQGVACA